MASKLANILQGKLFDKALDSIKFNKISTNTFDFKFQSKILDELQTGLNKFDINTIKTKVNDTLTSSFNSRITPDNPKTYKDAYLEDITNNPDKYFTNQDLDSIIRDLPPGTNLRSFIESNFNFEDFKEEALSQIKSGQSLTGKDGVLTPLIKQLLEISFIK